MKLDGQQFWTIGGGKGGVGKSFLTASMGVVLAEMGNSVIVVDADLGSANLHIFLGIKSPSHTLLDLLENRATVEEVLLPTSRPGLRLLSCAADIIGMANPASSEKEKIIKFISNLDAQYVLVDLGAGTSYNVLDFFNMSDEGIIVASPDPASIQNAYAFIKGAIFRRVQRKFGSDEAIASALRQFREGVGSAKPRTMMDFYDLICTTNPRLAENVAAMVDRYRPLIVVNMASSEEDQRIAEIIHSAAKRFLNVDLRFCGLVFADPAVRKAAQRLSVPDFRDVSCVAAQQIRLTVERLLSCSQTDAPLNSDQLAPATPMMGLNDNLEFMGKSLHIQTENLGFTGRRITTQVFCNGKVILSTKSEYPSSIRNQQDQSQVQELMRRQHFNVIREIEGKKCLLQPA
ncbi:MAG TPA: P-loop NTPase [Acidobacteriota bacterium]|nr:P-loop NTPase [Acidobacteriota bacterium]